MTQVRPRFDSGSTFGQDVDSNFVTTYNFVTWYNDSAVFSRFDLDWRQFKFLIGVFWHSFIQWVFKSCFSYKFTMQIWILVRNNRLRLLRAELEEIVSVKLKILRQYLIHNKFWCPGNLGGPTNLKIRGDPRVLQGGMKFELLSIPFPQDLLTWKIIVGVVNWAVYWFEIEWYK